VAAETRSRYGEAQAFLVTFSKDIQPVVAANPERAYLGMAPSLTTVANAYNRDVLITWIMAQMENLNDFVGVNRKLTIAQMEELANIIAVECHYLKVTEFHLFLHRMKSGRYGQFFGAVDPVRIMGGLTQFLDERISEISTYQRRQREAEMDALRDHWAKNGVSRDEYERMKAAQEDNMKNQ